MHDIILANQNNLIPNVKVTPGISPSDHGCVLFQLNATKKINSFAQDYYYKDLDWEIVRFAFHKNN